MFQCKSCGAALRFDIATQRMLCPYCESSYDPYEIKDTGNAEEEEFMDITIFTCPQCGGELSATENSAAEFCSYCGAPTVLGSRMSKMEKPSYIIPFKQTKEDCQKALNEKLKHNFFIPKEYKEAKADRFRGIYMPCWNYNVVQDNAVSMETEEESSQGTKIYKVTADVTANYHGIPHDASKGYSDRISESLEPFDYKHRKPFVPSFIAGFFSDIKDVDSMQYENDAITFANEQTYKRLISKVDVGRGSLRNPNVSDKTKMFDTRVESTDSTLIPVWFLSYRKGNRVAYAAVNGESGKVVSDMPVSVGKVLLVALMIAIPLFFILNFLVSMRATTLVLLSLGLNLITSILYCVQLSSILKREMNPDFVRARKKASKDGKVIKKKQSLIRQIGCLVVFAVPAMGMFITIIGIVSGMVYEGAMLVITVASIAVPIYGMKHYHPQKLHMKPHGFLFLLLAAIACLVVLITNPISDVYFYGVAVCSLAAILFTLYHVCKSLNMLATRPLPHFETRGGESHE